MKIDEARIEHGIKVALGYANPYCHCGKESVASYGRTDYRCRLHDYRSRILWDMKEHQILHGPHPAIELPLPPKELHPNQRVSWQAKHRVRGPYREACGLITAQYCKRFPVIPRWKEAVIKLEFLFASKKVRLRGRRRLHDPDNALAWVKSAIDGLADGGLIANDRYITYLPPDQTIIDGVNDGLLVIAWEGKLTFPNLP